MPSTAINIDRDVLLQGLCARFKVLSDFLVVGWVSCVAYEQLVHCIQTLYDHFIRAVALIACVRARQPFGNKEEGYQALRIPQADIPQALYI